MGVIVELTVLDILFAVILLSFVVAIYRRGFVNEIFSKLSWIGGAVLALLFTPLFAFTQLKEFIKIENEPILYFISFSILFIFAFFVIKLIGYFVGSIFTFPILDTLNHVLGALLGLLEAFIIISIILEILLMQNFISPHVWLKGSKLAPFFIQYLLGMKLYI